MYFLANVAYSKRMENTAHIAILDFQFDKCGCCSLCIGYSTWQTMLAKGFNLYDPFLFPFFYLIEQSSVRSTSNKSCQLGHVARWRLCLPIFLPIFHKEIGLATLLLHKTFHSHLLIESNWLLSALMWLQQFAAVAISQQRHKGG